MFEALMTAIKTKVVASELRSCTVTNVARMRAMMQAMQAAQARAQTNGEVIEGSVEGDAAAPAAAPEPAPRPVSAAENKKAVADVFASMMSRPVRFVPAARPAVPAAGMAPGGTVVGRNDPCPCGSGKKYKKCCGRGL